MTSDAELLCAYAKDRSEPAFAELVRRHVNLVYSVALRNLAGDTQLAEDVTQQVFTDLAQKAGVLSRHAVLGGWLYRSTQFAAAKTVRTERRRRLREQEAEAMQTSSASPEPDWEKLRPTLDRLIGELDARDRDAVWLRFVANQSYTEIGAKLGLSENAARMRVDRALAKLHQRLSRAGITSSLAAVGSALAGQARSIAPTGLAAAVMQAVATAPAVGSALLGGSLAASLALFFAGGLALGGAAAWALPESAISGAEPTMTARVLWSSGISPTVTRLRALTSPGPGPAATTSNDPAKPPEIDRILREVGLHPANDYAGPAPSWLNVSAPKAYLLKSKEYVELSIAAFEGRVDDACAPLFVQLNLGPETIDKLRRTMAEMLHARAEVETLASTREPVPTRAEISRLMDTSDDEYRQKIRSIVGEGRFAPFEDYFDLLPFRQQLQGVFGEIALRASPLTPTQRDALVAAFHAEVIGQATTTGSPAMLLPEQAATYERWLARELPNQKRILESIRRDQNDPRLPDHYHPIYKRSGSGNDRP